MYELYEFPTSGGETVDGITTMSGWSLKLVENIAELTGNTIPAGNVADCFQYNTWSPK